jgi:membrane-bound lytic murein transglycosylase A
VAALGLVVAGGDGAVSAPAGPGNASLSPMAWADVPGWASDDHAAAFAVFLLTCPGVAAGDPVLRPGLPPGRALVAACRAALATGPLGGDAARAFFETRFRPFAVSPPGGEGFLTGYYEPEVEASLVPSDRFPVPVLGRPLDLETLAPGETRPGLDPSLAAARRSPQGLVPYPDRAAIMDGALAGQGLEIAWMRDEVDLFYAQVQGSARLRLPDGTLARLVYAGRNGQPYTSIGRVVVAEGHMTIEGMSLERLQAWLRANPAEARRVMRLNRSYIFFAVRHDLDPAKGPVGAASVPLVPLRSIAVDRTLWPYGTPFVIAADLPEPAGGTSPFAALMIAQDTGSAILGPARADIFFGSGAAAGTRAGLVRHPGKFVVLLARDADP